MNHKFSKEILYHFNCGKCNKWWSISDHHLLSGDRAIISDKSIELSDKINCPHCGHPATPISEEETLSKTK